MTWTLGEHLAKARKDAALDQVELSKRVGIARNSLSNYETGRSVPPFDVAVRIAVVCGVSLEWLAEAVALDSQSEGWEFESLRAHTVLRQCDPRCNSDGGFVVPFWTDERAISLTNLWCQVEPDTEIAPLVGVE